MTRALLVIHSDADRERAAKWCRAAPAGMRIEFKNGKRSTAQNSLLWACLSDVAAQAEHNGRKYSADAWKLLFLHAIGREIQFIPALDNKTFIPWGQRSSDLSREEMTALIDFIQMWCAENGVKLHAPEESIA